MGERIDGHADLEFYHVCPGRGCAIKAWLKGRRLRLELRDAEGENEGERSEAKR